MPITPNCLITGCEFIDSAHPESYSHGDLHKFGDVYIFNATLDGNGEAARIDTRRLTPYSRIVTAVGAVFERRGVIVFQRTAAVLNDEARAYIEKGVLS